MLGKICMQDFLKGGALLIYRLGLIEKNSCFLCLNTVRLAFLCATCGLKGTKDNKRKENYNQKLEC